MNNITTKVAFKVVYVSFVVYYYPRWCILTQIALVMGFIYLSIMYVTCLYVYLYQTLIKCNYV